MWLYNLCDTVQDIFFYNLSLNLTNPRNILLSVNLPKKVSNMSDDWKIFSFWFRKLTIKQYTICTTCGSTGRKKRFSSRHRNSNLSFIITYYTFMPSNCNIWLTTQRAKCCLKWINALWETGRALQKHWTKIWEQSCNVHQETKQDISIVSRWGILGDSVAWARDAAAALQLASTPRQGPGRPVSHQQEWFTGTCLFIMYTYFVIKAMLVIYLPSLCGINDQQVTYTSSRSRFQIQAPS